MPKDPIVRWQNDAEKEWIFRQLWALGYRRGPYADVDVAWRTLSHSTYLNAIVTSEDYIIFARANSTCYMPFNSGRHFIEYLTAHQTVAQRS